MKTFLNSRLWVLLAAVVLAVGIVANSAPIITLIEISSNYGYNLTVENLTATATSSDGDSDPVKYIYNWYRNGTSVPMVNMPFEAGSNSTWTRDYTSYGNNGTVINATWNATGGYDGKGSYEFGGVNAGAESNKILIRGDPTGNYNLSHGSFLAWVRVDEHHSDDGQNKDLFQPDGGDRGIEISFSEDCGGDSMFFTGEKNKDWDTYAIIKYSDYANKGEWTHVGVTWAWNSSADNDVKFYINGDSKPLCGSALGNWDEIMPNPGNWSIGLESTAPTRAFNGSIDEVMLFDYTVPAEQVLAIYLNQTNVIVAEETETGENWSFCVTPNDGTEDGNTSCSGNITIVEDAIPPQVNLTSPADNTTSGSNTPQFSFEVNDNYVKSMSCVLWLENATENATYGQTSAANGSVSSITASAIENGEYFWWINCSDITNTNMSEKRNISIDYSPEPPPPPKDHGISILGVTPESPVLAGDDSSVSVEIKNTGDYSETVDVFIDGLPSGWSATEDSISLSAGEAGTSEVTVSVAAAEGAGTYGMTANVENDDVSDSEGFSIEVVECFVSGDCDEGGCIENSCVIHECIDDGDCDEGEECINNTCVGEECLTDDDCGEGEECINNTCVGEECLTDDDCGEGEECVNNTCVVVAECVFDSDCGEGMVCSEGVCVPDYECYVAGDCGEGFMCVNHSCVEAVECLDTSDCAEGEVCIGGICVEEIECFSDEECGEEEYCAGGQCKSKSSETPEDGEESGGGGPTGTGLTPEGIVIEERLVIEIPGIGKLGEVTIIHIYDEDGNPADAMIKLRKPDGSEIILRTKDGKLVLTPDMEGEWSINVIASGFLPSGGVLRVEKSTEAGAGEDDGEKTEMEKGVEAVFRVVVFSVPIIAVAFVAVIILGVRRKKRFVVPVDFADELERWENIEELQKLQVNKHAEIFTTNFYEEPYLKAEQLRRELLPYVDAVMESKGITRGEAEAIALAKQLKATVLTNNHYLVEACKEEGVACKVILDVDSIVGVLQKGKKLG